MKKLTRFLVPLLLGLLIIASIFWYLFMYDRAFTRDTLLSQARFQDMHGNSRMSAFFYDAAYSFSGRDENVAIELANQYKSSGNYTKAELTLTEAIRTGATAELYAALSKVFVEQDKLLDAVNLLNNVSDPAIKAELDAQRPTTPKSDYAPGYYNQYMLIHLDSTGETIYYTVDGEYPSTAGHVYGDCISLPSGETSVNAIAVNKSGLVSDLSVMEYTITGVIEQVTFTDAAMEKAIRDLIGADSDDKIYTNELWEIKEFTVPDGVKDYSDLALLPYLATLTIRNQTMDTLSALSALSSLETLDLTGCKFPTDDLAVLAGIPSLTDLTLSECGLSTIAGLEGAQNLSRLDLSNNTVRNLEVLSSMTTLREINLQHNAVTDLSALSSLSNLQTLNVGYNSLTTLSPISSCSLLSWLNADNNHLYDLNGVEYLTELSHLSANNNELTDVSILVGNTALTNLYFASNSISDISSLSALTKLQVFDFSGNQISALPEWPDGCPMTTIDGSYNALTSIDGLQNMQSLTHIYMDYNLLTNIDALENCYCLVQVNVYGNAIPDVSALRSRDIIVNYDPTVS